MTRKALKSVSVPTCTNNMALLHRVVKLKSGRKIRFITSVVRVSEIETIYQYVVDMLFQCNNWERVYCSHLYDDRFKFFLTLSKRITSPERFENIYLAKQAKKKYDL